MNGKVTEGMGKGQNKDGEGQKKNLKWIEEGWENNRKKDKKETV
jgi:hypothetical protein